MKRNLALGLLAGAVTAVVYWVKSHPSSIMLPNVTTDQTIVAPKVKGPKTISIYLPNPFSGLGVVTGPGLTVNPPSVLYATVDGAPVDVTSSTIYGAPGSPTSLQVQLTKPSGTIVLQASIPNVTGLGTAATPTYTIQYG